MIIKIKKINKKIRRSKATKTEKYDGMFSDFSKIKPRNWNVHRETTQK